MTPRRLEDRVFYLRVFALVVAAGLAWLTFQVLGPVLEPLCWAFLLAILLYPAQHWLTPRLFGRRSLAAGALTLLVFLVVAGPVSGLAGTFATEVGDLLSRFEASKPRTPLQMPEIREVPVAGESLDQLRRNLGISKGNVRGWLTATFTAALKALGPLSGKLFLGALSTMTAFAFMLVVLFFSLRDGQQLLAHTDELIPWPRAVKQKLAVDLRDLLRAVVFGTAVTAVLQGVLVGLAFAVVGLPAPVVFGALAALLAMLPIGGTAFVWGPGVLVLAVQEHWGAAAGLALWGVCLVGLIDNFLQPLLVAQRSRVGTLTIFIGVIGGLAGFGVIGLILGPLILLLVMELLKLLRGRTAAVVPPV